MERMKRTAGALLLGLALLLGGCGGGEVRISAEIPVVYPVDYAPAITWLSFWKDADRYFVPGSIDFTDPDADTGTMTIVVSDSFGRVMARTVADLDDYVGYTGGTVSFSIDYLTYPPGTYTFTIYLTDRGGNLSNPVYGTFQVW
ncbi:MULTISPECIES: hypothetical protein [Geobacter]|uniref:hypothetical protein n=1 Tax=Geobacter TaxID=28231 RepID=UPI0025736624|nr:hypothetical protein [Geobacter sulfurreducens]BEH11274.1 lipoprotein [Geobacter sulfurreducens subsp. ethanolicus]BET59122.1 lipoprotein [Geobacter sp. 60473]HML79327.1 hypothetical protein [Geobacter sulfurreducens]